MKTMYVYIFSSYLIKISKLYVAAILTASLVIASSCANDFDADNQITDLKTKVEAPDKQKIGKAYYRVRPLQRDNTVPDAPYRTKAMQQIAAPTNQWYSSVMFTQWSEVIHALPFTFKATNGLFELGLPTKKVVPTQRQDVEIFYPHTPDITVSPVGFVPKAANLDDFGDWHVRISLDNANEYLTSTLAHGSPFVYFETSQQYMQLRADASFITKIYPDDPRILLIQNENKNFAAFIPQGGKWQFQANNDQKTQRPTYGNRDEIIIYNGVLAENLRWETYNPDGDIEAKYSDNRSILFDDIQGGEDLYLTINKKGENGNIYAVFGDPESGERVDLSYWQEYGEITLDIRVHTKQPDAKLLVKIDSGWPNVSDYSVPLPNTGAWTKVRIPLQDLLQNGNRFNPGAYADIQKIENIIVIEPLGTMEIDIDNIVLRINTDIAQNKTGNWVANLPMHNQRMSLATLPDNNEKTLAAFIDSAYMFLQDTRVSWEYDTQKSQVHTLFTPQYTNIDSSVPDGIPILGLYPHHYYQNTQLPSTFIGDIASIRGPIQLFKTKTFTTSYHYNSFVPFWPITSDKDMAHMVQRQLSRDTSRARSMIIEIGWGAYWQGKGLQRISQLMNIAHVTQQESKKAALLALLKERMEEWFSTNDPNWYFHYAPNIGTLVAYPEEYDAVININDHHFHYGYWIRAAAEVALQDQNWIAQENYGAMIDLLVADIATNKRKQKDFPFLRNFDPYEGHSWAGGTQMSPDGNNQESSSEAVNAWAGLILWGVVTNNTDLIDLGIYLYTTEIQAIYHYWFDLANITLPDEYINKDVSIVFGGKLAHTTWWTDEPRQIHGINLIPLTPSSVYLAKDKAYIHAKLSALDDEMQIYTQRGKTAKPVDIWQDIFAKYLALANPRMGFESWDAYGSFELGDTRTHALHWMSALMHMGTPDVTIHANTPLYSVFRQEDGSKTYLVYNYSQSPTQVLFSDGTQITAPPMQLYVYPPQ